VRKAGHPGVTISTGISHYYKLLTEKTNRKKPKAFDLKKKKKKNPLSSSLGKFTKKGCHA